MMTGRSRPGRGNKLHRGAEPGMVSRHGLQMGCNASYSTCLMGLLCITGGEAMPAECCSLCLASSQHSRNVNRSYGFQGLGFIWGWDGSIKSPPWSHSGPVCLSPYDVRPPRHSSAIIKKLLSQQLIIGIRLPIHIIAAL